MSNVSDRQGALASFVGMDWRLVPGLPERHLLPPDGYSIEAHFENLYPVNLSERQLFEFARPENPFHDLLLPLKFRRALSDLLQGLAQFHDPASVAALQLLGELDEYEKLLRVARYLLQKA